MITRQNCSNPLQLISIKANTDIPPFRFVNAKGGLCAHTETPVGITETEWKTGDTMSVISYGVALIELLEAVNIGEKIGVSNSAGKARKKNAEDDWVGTALNSGTAGSIINVKLVV